MSKEKDYKVIEETEDDLIIEVSTPLEFIYDAADTRVETTIWIDKRDGFVLDKTHKLKFGYCGLYCECTVFNLEDLVIGINKHLRKIRKVIESLTGGEEKQ